MRKKILPILTFLLILFGFITTAQAQTSEPAVVRAVMFWMSGCKHCQQAISMTLPPIREKYGAQFNLQLIQIYSLEDIDALYALGASYGIEKHMVGVPFLVIGDQPLVGYDQVRLELPGLIEEHLAAGGVDLPDRPELQPLLAAAPNADSPTPAPAPMDYPPDPASPMHDNGFVLAIVVMAGMILALLYAATRLLIVMFRNTPPAATAGKANWLVPILAMFGLLVAIYLSYIELTLSQAFCGPVGDCNAVQSSSYARLFGILPVGVLGALGYIAILTAWWARRQQWGIVSKYAPLALFGMAFFGTIFSAYLTYLEPFVIQAVCIWCVTSAILITIIMLAALNPALQTLSFEEE
jgi:uncharacterized membrane protein